MQQGEGLFDDPADLAEPGTVVGAAAGDDGCDTLVANLSAVTVVVVAPVGVDGQGPAAGLAALAADGRYRVE